MASLFIFTACKKEVVITVKSNNESWGKVSGGGTYQKGEEIKLKATPTMSIYKFVKWEDGNTDNPRTIVVKKAATYTAVFEKTSGGGVSGGGDGPGPIYTSSFSVSDTTQVMFSPGNLQWSAKNGGSTATTHAVAGGGTAAGTWRFSPNQWDTIGANNNNISSSYSGWIDLFGWGTSGYSGNQPYMTSTSDEAYGPTRGNIAGTNYDWGVYNAIYNTQTQNTDEPGTWRALTRNEWEYMINRRQTASNIRFALATVHGITGLIIVPDDWDISVYTLKNTNQTIDYASNTISDADWTNMGNAGCVFLPAVSIRYGNVMQSVSVGGTNSIGSYWTTMRAYFDFASYRQTTYEGTLCQGRSVRLVRDVE